MYREWTKLYVDVEVAGVSLQLFTWLNGQAKCKLKSRVRSCILPVNLCMHLTSWNKDWLKIRGRNQGAVGWVGWQAQWALTVTWRCKAEKMAHFLALLPSLVLRLLLNGAIPGTGRHGWVMLGGGAMMSPCPRHAAENIRGTPFWRIRHISGQVWGGRSRLGKGIRSWQSCWCWYPRQQPLTYAHPYPSLQTVPPPPCPVPPTPLPTIHALAKLLALGHFHRPPWHIQDFASPF